MNEDWVKHAAEWQRQEKEKEKTFSSMGFFLGRLKDNFKAVAERIGIITGARSHFPGKPGAVVTLVMLIPILAIMLLHSPIDVFAWVILSFVFYMALDAWAATVMVKAYLRDKGDNL